MGYQGASESVIAWQTGGWVHGDVLDIGCGLGDNAIYLATNGHTVTGLDISPNALLIAEGRAKDAGVDVKFAVADSTKFEGYTDAFDTVIDIACSTASMMTADAVTPPRCTGPLGRAPPCCSAASRKPTR
jgi:SAM-dependent methyltransferase